MIAPRHIVWTKAWRGRLFHAVPAENLEPIPQTMQALCGYKPQGNTGHSRWDANDDVRPGAGLCCHECNYLVDADAEGVPA